MDLADLRLLVVLSEELHFGRAAARLHLSQPGLSYRVKRVEQALGYQVVTRDRRGIVLTPGGAQLLEGARRLLSEADRVVEDAARVAHGDLATLRVGVVGTALYRLLPSALRLLRAAHPDVRLLVEEGKSAAQLTALSAGTLDLGIVHLPVQGGVDLRTRELVSDPVGVALPADWDLARADEVRLTDLARHPWVLFPRSVEPTTHDRYVGACVAAGFAPRVAVEATGLTTILGLVAGGAGAAFVADSVAATSARAGVVFRSLTGPAPVLVTGAAWRASAPAGVDLLLEALTAAAATDDPLHLSSLSELFLD